MNTNHFGSWQVRDEIIESYGVVPASLLNDILGLLAAVNDRRKSHHEARTEVITRARAVLDEHVVIPRNEARRQKLADAAAQCEREAAELLIAAQGQADQPERVNAAARLWATIRRGSR